MWQRCLHYATDPHHNHQTASSLFMEEQFFLAKKSARDMLVARLSLLLNLQTHAETRSTRMCGTSDNNVFIMPPTHTISKPPARPTKSATDSIGRTSWAQPSRWTWFNHGLVIFDDAWQQVSLVIIEQVIDGITDRPGGEASGDSEVEVGGRVLQQL